jgi:hypothetical protein
MSSSTKDNHQMTFARVSLVRLAVLQGRCAWHAVVGTACKALCAALLLIVHSLASCAQ